MQLLGNAAQEMGRQAAYSLGRAVLAAAAGLLRDGEMY